MKPLTVVLGSMHLITLSSQPVTAQQTAGSLSAAVSPEIVLKEFYTWYILNSRCRVNSSPGL